MLARTQRTLKKTVQYSGIGIHLGRTSVLSLLPAAINTGIVFRRYDEFGQYYDIPATLDNVSSTGRCTTLSKNGISIATVEHLLASLKACNIDNVIVSCTEEEIPIGDGSSALFMKLIDKAGIQEQDAFVHPMVLPEPVFYQNQDIFLVAIPSNELKISYTLHYPQSASIGTQFRSITITEQSFREEIAPCRTFALHEELCFLMDRNLIGGGCLENAVVFKDCGTIRVGKQNFTDEPVRHKILDLVGDIALVSKPFLAHIMAIGSGHTSNIALGKKIEQLMVKVEIM